MTDHVHVYTLHKQANAAGWIFAFCCRHCFLRPTGGKSWTPKATIDPTAIATMPEIPALRDRCTVCGRIAVLELHHFAPVALFADADQWPTAKLCLPCHRRWHSTMRTT